MSRPNAEMTVDHEPDRAEHQVRHADHEIDAVVVGPREPNLVFFPQTGGSRDRLASRRTRHEAPTRHGQGEHQNEE